jgi:hypothetical protein
MQRAYPALPAAGDPLPVGAGLTRRYRDLMPGGSMSAPLPVTLRRLNAAGRPRLVCKGKSNHKALYTAPSPPVAAAPASAEGSRA